MPCGKRMESEFEIVRTHAAFPGYIEVKGFSRLIRFDNDSRLHDSGSVVPDDYTVTKWAVHESGPDLTGLEFTVYSTGPVASDQIQPAFDQFHESFEMRGCDYVMLLTNDRSPIQPSLFRMLHHRLFFT